jgi:hypothetical protein
MANQGNTDGVVKKVLFLLQVGQDQRNTGVFKTMSQAVEDHDKKTVNSARATVDKIAKVREDAAEKEKMRWATRLSRQMDAESKERDRFWAGESRKMDQRIAGASREQSLAAKGALRDAQAMGAQLTGLRDSALGFGKAMSYAGLIGEKDMTKLTDRLLMIETIFGGLQHGSDLISGARGLGRSIKGLAGAGPATIGRSIAEATGSAAAGNLAWKAGSSALGGALAHGAGALAGSPALAAGAAAIPLALLGGGISAYRMATGNTNHAGFDYTASSGLGLGYQKFATNVPGFSPGGWLAQNTGVMRGERARIEAQEKLLADMQSGRDITGQLAPLFAQRAALNASVGSRNLTPAQLAVARAASVRSGNPEMLSVLEGLGRQKNDLQFHKQSLEAALPYERDAAKQWQLVQNIKGVTQQILQLDQQDAQVKINGYKQAKSLAEGEYRSRQGGLFDRVAAFGNSDAATQADVKRIADKVKAGQALTQEERNFAMSNAAVPDEVRTYADYQSYSEGALKAGNTFAGDERSIAAARAKVESLKLEIDASKTEFRVTLDAADGLYDQLRDSFEDTFRQMADDIQRGANAAGKAAAAVYLKEQAQGQANYSSLNLGS